MGHEFGGDTDVRASEMWKGGAKAGAVGAFAGWTPENLPAATDLKKLKSKAKPKGRLDGEA